jgi:hypothetical protein
MTWMTATVRRAPLTLLAVLLVAVLVAGCAEDEPEPEAEADSGPTSGSTAGSTAGPAEQGLRSDLPSELQGTCTSYARMVDGIDALDGTEELDALAAEMAAVMAHWAEQVPDQGRPSGMDAPTWHGVRALAARIRRLPDQPTMKQLEAVERGLDAAERAAVDDASAWFKKNCGIS